MQSIYRILDNPLISRIVRNTGFLFGANGLTAVLGMLQGILIARLMGVENYGILGAVIVFTSVINRFFSFRMSELVVRYVGQYTEANDLTRAAAVFKAAGLVEMCASLVAFLLIWILAPYGAQYLAKDIHASTWFITYGLIVLANLIAESSTGLLQIADRFRRMAWLQAAQGALTLLVVAWVYFNQGGMMGILLAYLIGKGFGALGLTLAAMLEAHKRWGLNWWRVPLQVLRPEWRGLARFAVSTNISASLSLINKDGELLWISLLRGPLETGYYKLAMSLANLAQMPVSPLPQATYPELSRELARRNWSNVRQIMRQGSIISGGYTLAAAVALLVGGRWLITLMYTDQYLPAFPALLILLVGFVIANTFYWHRPALLAIGRADFPAKMNLVLAVLKIVGILLFVPRFGYLANAGLLAGSYILGVTVSVVVFRRELACLEQNKEGEKPG